jgi:hypothetical protein
MTTAKQAYAGFLRWLPARNQQRPRTRPTPPARQASPALRAMADLMVAQVKRSVANGVL